MKKQERVQYQSAPSLIRNLCCNYDGSTGGCLLLDRGEVVKCPQMTSTSLICRYFRDVLLEDPDSKALKAEIMSEACHKVCATCGVHFRAVTNRAKYCSRCAKQAAHEKSRQSAARKESKP